MDSRHTAHVEALVATVLEGPGQLDADLRRAAFTRGELPEPLASLVTKIHRNAWKVTDEDVAGARAAGWTQDQLFELIVCAAVGAARERLTAGMRALEQARATR
jgi:alkylhydroperoxidase family enzyme